MALADVEGARIHLKQFRIEHQMASWESMQDILIRHYTRQLLHEMYKVNGVKWFCWFVKSEQCFYTISA